MVTGFDLVAQQIQLAEGRPLTIKQADIQLNGHAVECRINAEDPARDFQPSPGRIAEVRFPKHEGLRVDTHIEDGAMIPPFYDSMIAKIIAHGPTRAVALRKLDAALADLRLVGVKTNQALHRDVLATPEFNEGGVDTGFLGRWLAEQTHNTSSGIKP